MSTVDIEADHDAAAAKADPMPRPEPEHRSMTGLKDGVLNVYTCVMSPHHARPIRAFSVSSVKPEAQYDQSVTITWTAPRKRKSLAMGFYPTNGQYATVEVGGNVVYDSRADIPCDMNLFNSSRARFDSTFNEPTTNPERDPTTMTTTDVATQDEPIEGEVVEPLTKKAAEALDKKIRAASDRFVTHREKLIELLDEAARGEIHEALGYSSWTAWVKDAVQIQVVDADERRALVALMSGKGMSQRVIAGTLNVSKKTVQNDQQHLDKGIQVNGADGKTYSRIPPKKKATPKPEPVEQEPQDAEEVDLPDEEVPPPVEKIIVEPKAPSNAHEFRDEVYKLQLCVSSFREIIYEDERCDRGQIAGLRITEEFRACLNELDELLDFIDGDD
jgi:hypothetical protein